MGADGGPPIVRRAKTAASAAEWRNRGAMLARSDVHAMAYDDYVRALTLDPVDGLALEGLAKTAALSGRAADGLSWVKGLTANRAQTPETLIATSKLLAATGAIADAIEAARQAALAQLASLFADAGDTVQLDVIVGEMNQQAPGRAPTLYYAAAAAFMHGRIEEAVRLAEGAIAVDPQYAPVYDLVGAAYTRLEQPARAREAFEKSLGFDAHDSTAYTNLGLIELAAGNRPAAANYFAEALGLAPSSTTAREGLARSR
jgi:Flp pilus assembly protein TadD